MAQQPSFIFPLLKSSDILECMKELRINVIDTKQELIEPMRHKEKVRKVFWSFLEHLRGITEEDLQNKKVQTEGLKYPELHDDVTDMLFFQELRSLMTLCGVLDFSWRDIHCPTSKRFRTQLSAMINMAKFRETQLEIYSELNEPRAQLLHTLQEIHNEHEELVAQLEQVQTASESKMQEMDQVVAECQELEMEIARNNKLQASKRELAATLKREANDLKDELASAQWALQETEAEEERLLSQIVSSPGRRTNEIAQKKERLEKEKEEARSIQEELQTNKAKILQLQNAIKNVKGTMELQKYVLQEATKYEEAMGQVDEASKNVQANQQQEQQILSQTEEEERGLHRAEEKITHMRKQGKMKMDAVQERLDSAKEQLLTVEMDRRDGMARVEAGEQEVRALEAQMAEEQAKTEAEISNLIAEYKEMEKAFLARNEQRMLIVNAAIM